MFPEHRIILSLGSNTDATTNIGKACDILRGLLGNVRFSRVLSTEPIGIGGPCFLNCLCLAYTSLTTLEVIDVAKQVESLMGSTREDRRKGRVRIDVDLLLYDDQRHHIADWERPYLKLLMAEMEGY
ncbi:MAG: 2-amino-4-hydroxy-6-hydroxymethyldihydropteridine diphosphokinase [Prevotella sp.]